LHASGLSSIYFWTSMIFRKDNVVGFSYLVVNTFSRLQSFRFPIPLFSVTVPVDVYVHPCFPISVCTYLPSQFLMVAMSSFLLFSDRSLRLGFPSFPSYFCVPTVSCVTHSPNISPGHFPSIEARPKSIHPSLTWLHLACSSGRLGVGGEGLLWAMF